MVYKVLTVEADYTEYDPFAILQLDPVSPSSVTAHHQSPCPAPSSRELPPLPSGSSTGS